ncbi:MAG TPA: hypothetical protein VFI96_05020 [Longimicrobiaceae bacterium]|nr:hypothetical protein [Longimicrobiaceae bacterium]
MSDLDIQATQPEIEDYSNWEIAYWIFGILMLPLAPILMIWFFTPWSGT